MFLKTESFEHNGVTVTLSELSALQRIEHLALMKRQAEQAESDSNRKFTVEDFSLLNRREADEEPEDDVLMQKAAGLAGGVRFGPDGNEVIPASPDVADMTEDDVMLMTVSEGIAGGVRYG
ncbi:TPA: phage minor tail protein G [Escherichia coli]|nr:phage minor tail protein G [Escherichia coli]HAZ7714535.1 phage minor tail protein G [Escherichia coli]HBA1080431.1 phage minor tail protein G [Escherichia coli]HBA1468969.1 phage minor tail protein G [Escherichia coli]HBA1493547.1 phage minor tail protein G [Escherichia coli]